MIGLEEATQIAGVAVAAWLVVWWGLRPLSFTYRLVDDCLIVSTFFSLPAANVPLSEIMVMSSTAPAMDKPRRWLVSFYRRMSRQLLFAETEREWLVLPDWLWETIRESGVKEMTDRDGNAPQLRGDAGYQRWLTVLMSLNMAVRKLASSCVPLSGAAAWCLILLPLWLTTVDLVGSKLFAEELHLPLSRVLGRATLPHFAASAFLISCGIAVRGLLAFGKSLPGPLAGISLFAAVSRLSIGFPGSHDVLSHTLFDSCTGYSDRLDGIGVASIVAAGIIALASWADAAKRDQFRVDSGLTATP